MDLRKEMAERLKQYQLLLAFAAKQNREEKKEQEQEEWTVPEIEGGNYSYWYVCSECRYQVDWHMDKCPNCKRRLNWNG